MYYIIINKYLIFKSCNLFLYFFNIKNVNVMFLNIFNV